MNTHSVPARAPVRARRHLPLPLVSLLRCRRDLARTLLTLAAAFVLPPSASATVADDAARLQEAAQLADRYVHPALRLEPCAENPGLDCGRLRVPIDYRQPWLGHVELAVVRARAAQRARRLGVLVANPGGPGGSGVDFVMQGVQAPGFIRLRERFDIVSFDVRGSHRSGEVRCEAPLPPAPAPAAIDELSRVLAANCLKQHGPLLTSMTTNNTARDIDVLRRSLGEKQISFVGLSYGTTLASVYATLFPQNLRAVLMDAGMKPDFHDSLVEFKAEQIISFETVLQRLDQVCAADAVCRLRSAGVSATLESMKAKLAQNPVTGPGGVVLTASRLAGALAPLLSQESRWPLIVDALADSAGGNFGLVFQLLAAAGASGGTPPGVLQATAQSIIFCNDFGSRRQAGEYLPVGNALSAVSGRIEAPLALATLVARCAAWPEGEQPLIRRSSVPMLLIGADFDPNTPLSWTLGLATLLGAENQVLRYRGGGHGSYATNGNTCVDAVGDGFLFDLKLPPPRTSCAARPIRFRAAAAATTESSARSRLQESTKSYWTPARVD